MKLSEKFQEYLFSKYPTVYRENDKGVLEQFTYALTDPAIPLIVKIENMYSLLTAKECPDEFVHAFFANFGGEFYDGVDLSYQRGILNNIVGILKKKGTVEGIEFLISAFSGIRTTVYGADSSALFGKGVLGTAVFGVSPTDVTVRMEMDYDAYGTFVDDTETLKKIIEEFMPFYVSATILFAYVFSDEASINGNDFILDKLFDIIKDDAQMTATEYDSMKSKFSDIETQELEFVEDVVQSVTLALLHDTVGVEISEKSYASIGRLDEESGTLDRYGKYGDRSGYLGGGVLGKAVLNEKDRLDTEYCKDEISESARDTPSVTVSEEESVTVADVLTEAFRVLNQDISSSIATVPTEENGTLNWGVMGKMTLNDGSTRQIAYEY